MENEDILNEEITSAAGAGFTTQNAVTDQAAAPDVAVAGPEAPTFNLTDDELNFFPQDDQALIDLQAARINDVLGSDAINLDGTTDEELLAQLVEFANTPILDLAATTGAVTADAPAPTLDEQLQTIATTETTTPTDDGGTQDEGPIQTFTPTPDDESNDGLEELPTDIGDITSQTGAVDGDGAENPDSVDTTGMTDNVLDCPLDMGVQPMMTTAEPTDIQTDEDALALAADDDAAAEPITADDTDVGEPVEIEPTAAVEPTEVADPVIEPIVADDGLVDLQPDLTVMDMVAALVGMDEPTDEMMTVEMDDCL